MPLFPEAVRGGCRILVLTAAFVAGCDATGPTSGPATPSTPPTASRTTDPAVGLADPLAAFEGRLRDATTREGGLVRALAAASGGGPSEMRLAVTRMHEWIDGERTWLTAHPAAPCFAAAVAKYREAVDAMSTAADLFAATVTGPATRSGDPIGAAAGQALQDAARALADTAVLATTARPNCR